MWSLRPDLNRRRRLCRPLLNHSATETGPALARVELGQLNVQVGKCCRRLSVRPFLAEPGAKTVEPTYIGVQHLLKLFRTSFGSRSLPLLACGLHRTLLARGVIGGLESVVLLLKFLEGRHGGYVFRQGCLLGNRLLSGSDTFCQKVSRFNHTNLLCTVDSGLQRGYRSHSRRPHRRTSRYGTVRCELAVGLARFEHAISWPQPGGLTKLSHSLWIFRSLSVSNSVPPTGFEPATIGVESRCAVHCATEACSCRTVILSRGCHQGQVETSRPILA